MKLIRQYPSAAALRDADIGRISEMLISDSYGYKGEAFAAGLVKTAQKSIGTSSSVKQMILKQKGDLLLYMEDSLQEITGMLIEISRKLMEDNINIMTSIKGIGDTTAVNFLIEMGGDIHQFERSGKIIALAGLDPAVYQSRKH